MHLRKQRDAALRAYASLRFGFENQDDKEVDKLMTESKVIAAIDEVMKKASIESSVPVVRRTWSFFLNSLLLQSTHLVSLTQPLTRMLRIT